MRLNEQYILVINLEDWQAAGLTVKMYKHGKERNQLTATRGGNGRPVEIEYESLPERFKASIEARFGNPYILIQNQSIKEHLEFDKAASDFYATHKLADGSNLPTTHQQKYTEAAKWLNLCKQVDDGGRKFLQQLGITDKTAFYDILIKFIGTDKILLPANYAKLKAKIKAYKVDGYKALISAKFANKNSVKITSDTCESVLLEMLRHPHYFEFTLIAVKYNQWAALNGYKPITAATVGNFYRAHEKDIKFYREGKAKWTDKFDLVVPRTGPTAPLLLINSDDNDLDWYFKEMRTNAKGHQATNHYFRFKLYVVKDAYTNYPLGYAWGEEVTKEVIKAAYLNAIHHVKEITGEQLIWHQIQTDRWGLKSEELRSFYERQAKFDAAKWGNARAKVIESSFAGPWHFVLKQMPGVGYAGHNIKAKQTINPDAIAANKNDFYPVEHGPAFIHEFIKRLRNYRKNETGPTLQEAYLDAFGKMPAELKRPLTDTERLLWFGKKHEELSSLTNRGLEMSVANTKYSYFPSKEQFEKHAYTRFEKFFDPMDMSKILAITPDGRVQIELNVPDKAKMAWMDMAEGDRTLLNKYLTAKKEIKQGVIDNREKSREILQRNQIDAESLLQAGVLDKSVKQAAEKVYLSAGEANDTEFNPFELM